MESDRPPADSEDMALPDSSGPAPVLQPSPGGSRVRVLVADDDPDIRTLVVLLLEAQGHTVLAAGSGQEALDLAIAQQPDIAVLDVMMPGLDGYDVTRELRADARLSEIPVLLLTALSNGDDVARGFEAGADDYLRKPFLSEELEARVQALLIRRKLMGRLVEQARTDSLTGLPNRRAWDEELPRELERSARYDHDVCLAMLDFDSFKNFNDERGHRAGDAFLQEVARSWEVHVRGIDVLARLGGDEFALLLPKCSFEEAMRVVERLRTGVPGHESCSVGLAEWDGREGAESLVERADQALYAAKRGGRDGLVLSPKPLPDSDVG
jgi:diguanylate cyclase (GGDEF)-like protein